MCFGRPHPSSKHIYTLRQSVRTGCPHRLSATMTEVTLVSDILARLEHVERETTDAEFEVLISRVRFSGLILSECLRLIDTPFYPPPVIVPPPTLSFVFICRHPLLLSHALLDFMYINCVCTLTSSSWWLLDRRMTCLLTGCESCMGMALFHQA